MWELLYIFAQNQLNVVPVIGLLAKMEDFKPVLNPDEVDAIFDVQLEMFFKVNFTLKFLNNIINRRRIDAH